MLSLISCKSKKSDNAIIKELTEKFPQLAAADPENAYLLRRITTSNDHTQIALYKVSDSTNDEQQLFIIKNQAGQYYAFPFFSNTFSDYWNFQPCGAASNSKDTVDNFEREFNAFLNAMHPKKTEAFHLINEVMLSALHCRVLEKTDSIGFNSISRSYNDYLPDESDSSCYQRMRENWRSLSHELFTEKFVAKIAYWDKENGRVYLFDLTDISNKLPFYIKIRVFRQDCVLHVMTL